MTEEFEFPLLQTVFCETLSGENFIARVKELEAKGAKIETWERGKSNAEWIVTWRFGSKSNAAVVSHESPV